MSWTPRAGIESPDDWVESTARLPLAFAQVREDPLIDRQLVEMLPGRVDVLMIASGGCTASLLAAVPRVGHLRLVDVNAAQLALCRLKLFMLQQCEPDVRLALLGHAPMDASQRLDRLSAALTALDQPVDVLGPTELLAEFGPDQLGRYEWLFARLRQELLPLRSELEALLLLCEPDEQSRRAAPETPLGRGLDMALDRVMDLEPLVRLFGPRATANRVQPFARHFAGRIRHALATLPATDNPYLWQMLAGRFPPRCTYQWLTQPRATKLPSVEWTHCAMEEALESLPAEQFDLVHLSNILDWVTPQTAERVLERTAHVLRPGGLAVIRQLNSQLAIRDVPCSLRWLVDEAARWHTEDRSFFYRELHVGRKR